MNIKVVLLMSLCFTLLTGCVVRPAHRGPVVRVKAPVKTVVVLEKEHQHRNIVVVNVKPAKKKKCWVHKKHWHCHR